MINKSISLRVTEEEYNFLKEKVDYFYYDNVSSYIRSLIRDEILKEKEDDPEYLFI